MRKTLSGYALLLAIAAIALLMVKLTRPSQPATTAADLLGDLARCKAYSGLPAGWPSAAHAGMVRVNGGAFDYGSTRGYADERPVATSTVEGFWMDRTEVSNAQFARFVEATGYVTEAERGDGAAVFIPPSGAEEVTPNSWWYLVKGADWRHPEGPGSSINGRAHEPVVNVTYADATAYARWLGHTLPSEMQWEYAAKAGRSNEEADKALRDAQGHLQANFWQGFFPLKDDAQDGFAGRAPVGCFPPNGFGLHDMVGNVWEWTRDTYGARDSAGLREDGLTTAIAPRAGVAAHVIKGGSYLCSANYCVRARASSRQPQEDDLAAEHLGFRTVSAR